MSTFLSRLCQGFEGAQCQVPLRGCDTVTCENQGVCISSRGRNYCECPLDVEGQACNRGEMVDMCKDVLL